MMKLGISLRVFIPKRPDLPEGPRRGIARLKSKYGVVLSSALHGALIAGVRGTIAGVGWRCAAKYAARGALVGAVGGAMPLILTWGTLGVEIGALIKTLGQSRRLGVRC